MRHVLITYYVQVIITDAKILVCIKTFWYLGIHWRISSTSALTVCGKSSWPIATPAILFSRML